MGVEVLCRVEVLPRVGGTHGCLLVTSTPLSRMVICAVRVIMYTRNGPAQARVMMKSVLSSAEHGRCPHKY